VQVDFAPLPPSIEYVKAGKLRALAVTSATRSKALADLPAMSEFLPGYEASALTGLGEPRNTPAEIIDKINKEINSAASTGVPRRRGRAASEGWYARLEAFQLIANSDLSG
jgi:tripartite-type tricarboxylate transporter receptor subunit TctC